MPLQLIEGMSSRKRRPNWTDHECLLLAQLMQEKKDIIRGKCSTGISIQDKRQAWEEIAQAINNVFPQIQRTVSDCNKKWENLMAKSREEIKRQRRQAITEGLSLEQFSTVTQVVISVMNLSDMLQQDKEDSSISELVESQQNNCDDDGNDGSIDERFCRKHPLRELEVPAYPDPSNSPAEQKMTVFANIPKSLAVHFSTPRAACFAASTEHLDTPSSSSPPSVHCTTLQERLDLEMSVLRRQEAVLKLQEEYYTLKIKMMKKKVDDPLSKD
ncbi:myb-related transcription factor, partner of profilin-like isoform X2 [Cottoperca gobio]|nr:myb-related transcription factor, partner of profilin-like isoform X2 [Cottoperca gobio]